jgi:hypothetical protein
MLFEMKEDLDKLLETTRQEIIVDQEAPLPRWQQDIVQAEQSANTTPTTTIEDYLKNLMSIQRP